MIIDGKWAVRMSKTGDRDYWHIFTEGRENVAVFRDRDEAEMVCRLVNGASGAEGKWKNPKYNLPKESQNVLGQTEERGVIDVQHIEGGRFVDESGATVNVRHWIGKT